MRSPPAYYPDSPRPFPRTKWTRHVPPRVLRGHAAGEPRAGDVAQAVCRALAARAELGAPEPLAAALEACAEALVPALGAAPRARRAAPGGAAPQPLDAGAAARALLGAGSPIPALRLHRSPAVAAGARSVYAALLLAPAAPPPAGAPGAALWGAGSEEVLAPSPRPDKSGPKAFGPCCRRCTPRRGARCAAAGLNPICTRRGA